MHIIADFSTTLTILLCGSYYYCNRVLLFNALKKPRHFFKFAVDISTIGFSGHCRLVRHCKQEE